MRNRELHDALREFALESAALLSTELDAGEELPYDVVEEPGTGSVLYRYLPLTSAFIAERWDVVSAMPPARRAIEALGNGAEAYLRLRGLPPASDAEPALHAMLDRLYEDATDFQFPEERFERVYSEVERTLYEGTMRTAVVAAVHGLVLDSDRVDLGGGLMLARGDRIDAPPEAVWPLGPGERERTSGPNAVCALERDVEADSPLPASEARVRFRRLLTAMRLFKSGRAAFAGLAWGRADGGVWQPVPLALGGPGRGEPWLLTVDEEVQLRELVELIAAVRHGGRVAWSLARFEMGCERSTDAESLSDHLLALRSLLGAQDEAGRVSLAPRLAALCAEDSAREVVRGRIEHAFALERRTMEGAVIDEDAEVPPHALVAEVEQHVRALLRDVVCGYLDHDLVSVADDILLAGSDPIEIHAHDTRGEPQPEPEEQPTPEADAEPDSDGHPAVNSATRLPEGPGTAADPRSAAWAVAALPGPRTQRQADPPQAEDRVDVETQGEPETPSEPEMADVPERADEPELDSGVTPSADWDDDPASYSAPI